MGVVGCGQICPAACERGGPPRRQQTAQEAARAGARQEGLRLSGAAGSQPVRQPRRGRAIGLDAPWYGRATVQTRRGMDAPKAAKARTRAMSGSLGPDAGGCSAGRAGQGTQG